MNQTDFFKKFYITTLTLFAVFLYGCDISDSNKSTVSEELSEEELEVAGQIIAESLSDQKDGIFASLNDAFSLPSSSNLTEGSVEKGKYASPLFSTAMAKNSNTNANNYSYNYDPDTGIHLVNFSRNVNEEDFTKESTAELEYIYYDTDGAFIYSPRLDSDLIETIEYTGFRSGSIITPNKNSSYERNDEFLIDGLASDGPLTIEGLHEGSGQFEVTRENGDIIKRDYTLTVEFLDVQISSQTLTDGSLQKNVEGALAYEMMISKNLNGNESMKTVNGTIEFNGDGTALLRFQNILDDFKVTLEQGNLIGDNEFEGFVESVDTESDPEAFTLSDGQTYLFGTDTEINSEGDLTTLAEVQNVLESDIRVQAEGTFAENADGAFIIQSVKFEYEDDDLEFEDTVESVDTEAGTFTLENGDILHITDETNFDEDGDLFTLEDLLWALDNEFTVEAEGEFAPDGDGASDVTEVKFEYDEEDFEFDDDVASVDEENTSFTLENGDIYIINERTTFHNRSDINSFEELATAISEGAEVEAEGEYTPQSDGSRVVAIVKFETDDNDGEGDDGNDDEDRTEIDFSGNVESADASAKTFSLQSGLVIHTNDETEFDDDIQSLGNLVGAIQRGDKISVEGEYYKDSEENNIALELEFDVDRRNGNDDEDGDSDDDDSDEDRDEFEFEGDVNSADAGAKTFQVDDVTFYVTNGTEFDGDLNSLGNLVGALQRGDTVEAEGEYYTDDEGRNIVTEVEFDAERREDDDDDSDDDGDDDSDDDDDREEFDFEGSITSATSTTFTLDGQTFTVNDDTEIDGDDGVNSLQDVMDALDDGDNVEAEGEYYVDGTDNIVIEVEFDVEREDEEDDDDGSDDDEDREEFDFDGSITSATSTTFTLDGQTFTVNNDTEIDGDDGVNSLQDVMDALDDGDNVEAEGEYYIDGADNIVIEVEFDVEREDDDDDEEDDESEFDGRVNSVNLAGNSIELMNGNIFVLNSDTQFDDDGDLFSLQEVADDLADGYVVTTEGMYDPQDDGTNLVLSVKFESNRDDDDDGGDDDEDREELDFEGSVTSATSTTFTLDGQTFTVNDDTEIDGDDGVNSLQDVMDALDDGDDVEAEGEYYVDGADNIVIEVEFDVERDDDDGDDSDDGDEDDD